MAKFVAELPDAIMKDFETIYGSTEKIFGEMTKAGALVAYNNIVANVPVENLMAMYDAVHEFNGDK